MPEGKLKKYGWEIEVAWRGICPMWASYWGRALSRIEVASDLEAGTAV
jgi:hypothetical protein